jgi:nitrate/nitrite-specific signal transduction histidine kinase
MSDPAEQRARELLSENEQLRGERAALIEQLAKADQQNREAHSQYAALARQNANLANLYVASYRLHSTVSREEVLAAIVEIIINFVGSEEIAIFELKPGSHLLHLAMSFGIPAERLEPTMMSIGRVGEAAATGRLYVAPADAVADGTPPEESALTACIPLLLDGRVLAVVALYRLLQQKEALSELDHELFDFLGASAAAALHWATLLQCSNVHAPEVPV